MRKYHYFVEGKCEKKLIDTLKEQKNIIIPGKVEVLNVAEERLTDLKLRTLSDGTVIILVFDTDIPQTEILKENISILSKGNRFKTVWCVLQVPNFEGEIVRSTNMKDVKELFGSKNLDSFKSDFIKEKNLYKKLCCKEFDIDKIWDSKPGKEYSWLTNDGYRIKQK